MLSIEKIDAEHRTSKAKEDGEASNGNQKSPRGLEGDRGDRGKMYKNTARIQKIWLEADVLSLALLIDSTEKLSSTGYFVRFSNEENKGELLAEAMLRQPEAGYSASLHIL